MADNDNPSEGPLSIEDALDAMEDREAAPEVEDGETLETEAEELEAEEVEAEEETEDESDEQDEPTEESEGPEVYDATEYGEISIKLKDGTQTTLADLVNGNLRHADYTRKTQATAEREKQLGAKEQELAERERQLQEQFASLEEPEPDWEKLFEEDPLGAPLAKHQWDKKVAAKKQAEAQAQAQAEAQKHQFATQTAQIAMQAMPEWAQEGAFEANASARKKAALNAGFTEQEYSGSVDYRLAVLLEKAARYDAGQEKVNVATKKLSKVKKVVKPGTSETKADKENAARVAKSKRLNGPVSVQEYLNVKLSD